MENYSLFLLCINPKSVSISLFWFSISLQKCDWQSLNRFQGPTTKRQPLVGRKQLIFWSQASERIWLNQATPALISPFFPAWKPAGFIQWHCPWTSSLLYTKQIRFPYSSGKQVLSFVIGASLLILRQANFPVPLVFEFLGCSRGSLEGSTELQQSPCSDLTPLSWNFKT